MKKVLIAALALSLILLASCSTTSSDNPATISVSGFSTVYMNPDMASFTVSAEALRDTTDEARNAIDGIITEAVKIMKDKYGVSDEEIRTNYLTLSPEYTYVDNQRVLAGQRGSQSIDITIADIDLIGPIVEDLAKINGISISSITLDKKDKSEEIAQSRRLSIQDAMSKASTYAEAIGASIKDIVSIYENSASPRYVSPLRMEAAALTANADASYKTSFYDYELSCSDSISLIVSIE